MGINEKLALAFFLVGFAVAVVLGSWTAVVLAIFVASLYTVNKFAERKMPERKPEPTAGELAERQTAFEKEIREELLRLATQTGIRNNIGMR